jgi:hypothetical protein
MSLEVAAVNNIVMGSDFWIATSIFILAYILIVAEKRAGLAKLDSGISVKAAL